MLKMDHAGFNPRLRPGSIAASPGTRKTAAFGPPAVLAYCSLSMLAAFSGAADAQTPPVTKAQDCFDRTQAVVQQVRRDTFTNNCGRNLKLIGGRTDKEDGATISCVRIDSRIETNNIHPNRKSWTFITSSINSDFPARICYQYNDARTQYNSGYKACNSSLRGECGDDVSNLRILLPAELPRGTIALTPSTISLTEGSGSSSVSVSLTLSDSTKPPESDVIIDISSDNSDVTFSQSRLTFTSGNYGTAQSVSISANGDVDSSNETASIIFTPNVGSGLYVANGTITANVTDDDDNQLILSAATLKINEGDGDGATFTVKLASLPAATMTVNLASTGADVILDKTSLQFTPNNWGTAQTVKVSAAIDGTNDDETAIINLTGTGIFPNSVSVNLYERIEAYRDTTYGNRNLIAVHEGSTATFTYVLRQQPPGTRTIELGRSDTLLEYSVAGGAPTGQKLTLTFTPDNWNTPQTVTIHAAEDADKTDRPENNYQHIRLGDGLAHAAGVHGFRVAIHDNDIDLVVSAGGTLSLNEGGNATFDVKLSHAVVHNRKITLASDNSDITFDNSTLTFTSDNWGTDRLVTVSAAHDNDTADDSAAISVAGTGFTDASVTASVSDDDDVALTLSKTSMTVDEGSTDTFSVELATDPGENMSVALVSDNTDVTLSAATLNFTGGSDGNWDTARVVTVTAGEDDDHDNDSATIDLTGTRITAADVTVTVTDNDFGLDLSVSSLTVTEGADNTFTVALKTEPSADVAVTLVQPTNTDVTIDETTLTFTTTNWSAAQTVTVSAAEDDDIIADMATISLSASGGDYDGVTDEVTVSVAENDTAGLVFPGTDLEVGENDSATFEVKLGSEPSAAVTVTLTQPTNTDVTIDTDTGTAGNQNTLEFTTANWDTAQTVTVEASDDDDAADDTATIGLSASGGDYEGLTGSVTVDVDDDDEVKLILSTTTLPVDEDDSATFTVKLDSVPSGDVTVTLAQSGTANAYVTFTSSLTFTTSNWADTQDVTVSAADDSDSDSESATIGLTASGGGYDSATGSVTVNVTDDDIELELSVTSLSVGENDSATFTVNLVNEPFDDVTVTLAQSGRVNDDVTFSPSSLDFTASNWSTAQTVVVSAAADEDIENESATIVLTAAGGIDAQEVAVEVKVEDDDLPGGLSLFPTGALEVVKGDSAVLGVSLAIEPSVAGLEVSLSNTDPSLTLVPASLTFTDENWNQAQSVVLNAVADGDVEGGSDIITLTITGGGNYTDVADVSIPVRILDFPGGFTLSPTTLSLIEGGDSVGLEARLEIRPTGALTVVVTFAADRSGIEMNPSVLIFPFDGWDAPQRIGIKAIDDFNAVDERVTITARAVGGNYRSVERMATVSVKDDDDESAPLPPVKSMALAFPPASAQDSAVMRVRCRQDSPCDVVLDCHAQADGSTFEASLPEPIPAWGTLTLTAADIEGHTGASWAGKGRLGCALRSEGSLSSQVWTRSGDGVLVNNSAFIRSVAEGEGHRADIESIPEPESAEKSNFRIRCEASQGDDCTATRFSCYDDAGVRYDGDLGTVERLQVRHLQTAELVDIIDHRWEGMGLVCELRSSAPFTVQVLTRTGGGGALVNNSATGAR